jgi:hypothetical protein
VSAPVRLTGATSILLVRRFICVERTAVSVLESPQFSHQQDAGGSSLSFPLDTYGAKADYLVYNRGELMRLATTLNNPLNSSTTRSLEKVSLLARLFSL